MEERNYHIESGRFREQTLPLTENACQASLPARAGGKPEHSDFYTVKLFDINHINLRPGKNIGGRIPWRADSLQAIPEAAAEGLRKRAFRNIVHMTHRFRFSSVV